MSLNHFVDLDRVRFKPSDERHMKNHAGHHKLNRKGYSEVLFPAWYTGRGGNQPESNPRPRPRNFCRKIILPYPSRLVNIRNPYLICVVKEGCASAYPSVQTLTG